MHDPDLSVRALIEELASRPDETHTLQSVVDLAVTTVDGCTWAGITLNAPTGFVTAAATGPIVERADARQYELEEGPCVDAATADGYHLIPHTADETRWPRWAPAANSLGIESVLSVHLGTPRDAIGALNLYSAQQDAFGDDAIDMALDYAAHASAVLAVARTISGPQTGLQSRHTIGVAQGILVCRNGLTVDQSFKVLVRLSRTNNVKLRDVAAQIVRTRGIPDHMLAPG